MIRPQATAGAGVERRTDAMEGREWRWNGPQRGHGSCKSLEQT